MTGDADQGEQRYHERFAAERAEGRFVVPQCSECRTRFWHPRRHCPKCGSPRIDFVEPTWPAHVYTYTVNHRAKKDDQGPGATMIGYVELDDGLRLLTNLEHVDEEHAIGTAVSPEPHITDDGVVFVFVPVVS